jgi:ribosomal protein S18 acetylase RimI-like enzyme
MTIRPFRSEDRAGVWSILEPMIRAGETMALPQEMSEWEAIAFWTGPDRETFVVEEEGQLVGTYYLKANQLGGGAHVANCGYVTALSATGRGVARTMCAHSLARAKDQGFRAMQFNFVVSTNTRAVRLWESFGFEIVARLPDVFLSPQAGYVDALVMFRTL